MKTHLFVPTKLAYAQGDRPDVPCILCEVVAGRDTVTRLDLHETDNFLVSLNLHPYNPGHLLIFPKRHVQDLAALGRDEVVELHELELLCLDVLQERYSPHGYNLGVNLGPASGASIEHLHVHVVPRYEKELGFVDIIGGAKIIVEDPVVTCEELRKEFLLRSKQFTKETSDGKR